MVGGGMPLKLKPYAPKKDMIANKKEGKGKGRWIHDKRRKEQERSGERKKIIKIKRKEGKNKEVGRSDKRKLINKIESHYHHQLNTYK